MLSTSTIAILKALNPQEIKRFGDFINSPYHNSIKGLDKIYKIVLKTYPDFTSADLKPEAMAKKVFGAGAYKEKRLKNLCAEFGNLLRKFIGQEEQKNFDYDMDLYIASGLNKKNLFDISKKFIESSLAKNYDGAVIDNMKFYYHQKINQLLRTSIIKSTNLAKHDVDEAEVSIQDTVIIKLLREAYMEAYCALVVKDHRVSRTTLMENFLKAFDANTFLNSLKESDNQYYLYLKVNYLLFYYHENGISEEQFYSLKDEIFRLIPNVEKWEAYTIIGRARSIIVNYLMKQSPKYSKDILDFSKLVHELKLFPNKSGDFLQIQDFTDMFLSGIVQKEYDWAENFAIEYSQYLSEEHKENQRKYCLGIVQLKKGEHEKSMEFLSKVKMIGDVQKMNVRFYCLINYVEMKAYENALSLLQSITQLCSDNKEMSPLVSVRVPNALKYFREVIKCETEGKKPDEFIYEEARSKSNYYHKSYILEKMEKLK